MNQNKVARIVLSAAAIVHLINFLFSGQMSIWGYVIPPVLSLFVSIFLGYLAYTLKPQKKYKLIKIFYPLLILLFPLIGKIFFKLDWIGFDFLVMALLILSFSFLINLTLYYLKSSKFKFLLVLILVTTFILIWAELAVGIFGTAFAGS